jgi:hypothetical protein
MIEAHESAHLIRFGLFLGNFVYKAYLRRPMGLRK